MVNDDFRRAPKDEIITPCARELRRITDVHDHEKHSNYGQVHMQKRVGGNDRCWQKNAGSRRPGVRIDAS